MSAPVLTLKEQKASISGKKKKRKTMKNILSIPSNLKVESLCVEIKEIRKLIKILERLLPTARLPLERHDKSSQNSNEQTNTDSELRAEAKKKRNQLSLGVNALNRSIKQELISAVLLANDIQPKFLIHHLNLLCIHNKVPFLEMPGLREITKNYLGFPCIAVGFKKDFCDFSEVVDEVKSITQSRIVASKEDNQETAVESSESQEDISGYKSMESSVKCDEIPFQYLYRTSAKERVFNPSNDDESKLKSKTEFITVDDVDKETKIKNSSVDLGISNKFMKNKKKKIKNLEKLDDDDDDDDDDSSEDEDLKVPRKKIKKDWVIDTVGTKRKEIHYHPPNLSRFSSNPDRSSRKNK